MTGPGEPVRVLIADDQKVVRDGLRLMLSLLDGIEVVGTAVDGDDAVRQAAATRPDVVLMDLNMPGCDGVEATRRLAAAQPETRVVVLTTYDDDTWVLAALRAGARGYLTKDADAADIQRAIVAVAAGKADLDAGVQALLLDALARGAPVGVPATPRPAELPDALTAREAEVLTEIAAGLSNTEIAAKFVVSEATVKTHVGHLLAKTGMRDRAQLVAYAYRHGLVSP